MDVEPNAEILGFFEHIKSTYPQVGITIDLPFSEGGCWFIDITSNKVFISIEWSEITGFSVEITRADDDDSAKNSPTELFDSVDNVQERLSEILKS